MDVDKRVVCIEENVRGVCSKVKRKGREILNDFSITAPQFEALLVLTKRKNITIGELSNNMNLACSTVTELIYRMEKNEFVRRSRDLNDKRIVKIIVMEKGYKVIDEVLNRRREYLRDIFKDYSDKEIDVINKMFKVLNNSMSL
ncbi:MAG: MarR family transcriptional regulator [Firmicutes bacterium]|jgi:DNA-binding MarR family transcriptional regulator|nr:MarR family transcriptional regulator [Bacillota bacterium]